MFVASRNARGCRWRRFGRFFGAVDDRSRPSPQRCHGELLMVSPAIYSKRCMFTTGGRFPLALLDDAGPTPPMLLLTPSPCLSSSFSLLRSRSFGPPLPLRLCNSPPAIQRTVFLRIWTLSLRYVCVNAPARPAHIDAAHFRYLARSASPLVKLWFVGARGLVSLPSHFRGYAPSTTSRRMTCNISVLSCRYVLFSYTCKTRWCHYSKAVPLAQRGCW